MTHSVGRQSGAPFVSGPSGTNNVTTAFTGGPWTYIRTHVDSSAETLATWRLDEDTSSLVTLKNGTTSNATFAPLWNTVVNDGSLAHRNQTEILAAGDTGATPVMAYNVRRTTPAAVTTRPLYQWEDNSTAVLQLLPLNSGANGALSWGTQSGAVPAFTTRSAGTRLILYSAVDGTHVDNAIGAEASGTGIYQSVQQATSTYSHRWFGGTTQLAMLRADGIFNVGSSSGVYSRLGQKLETNTSAAYGGAALNTWSATAAEASLLDFNRARSATIGTYSVVASGDGLGQIVFRGADGATFRDAAGIVAESDGTPGGSDMPGRLIFQTTPDGSITRTERMRITNAGDVGIGKTPTTGIILDVGGQLGLKSYTVATLPSAAVQAGACVYASDAGGNGPCIAVSNGTNWKRCDNTSTTVS